MYDLTILHGASLKAVGQAKENSEKNQAVAEEMVRDLAERGVLDGEFGEYQLRGDADASVPATLQAAIGARIDRLEPAAKRTLNAASVIGTTFDDDLLHALDDHLDVDPLIEAELVDQARFSPQAMYAFRHPMIRSVAYESQLKSDRAELHRRLAVVIEARSPSSADENAALIAEHLEAAGDLHAAYGWQMRAAAWATNRDINAARLSWERAETSPTHYPPTTPTGPPCASPRGPCCAGSPFESN